MLSKVVVLMCLVVSTMATPPSWAQFKVAYRKNYNSPSEESRRANIYNQNLQRINEHNLKAKNGQATYTVAVNEYADLTASEFSQIYNGFKANPLQVNVQVALDVPISLSSSSGPNLQALPTSVNWTAQGYVTPVKDQGQCGSCYSFSSTGSLEGQWYKKYNTLRSLSEQNIVDCSKSYGNNGCGGGNMGNSFNYIKTNKGIDLGSYYPYTATDNSSCKYNVAGIGANVTGFVQLTQGSESALQNAVATVGPISVAIDASQWSFQLYSSGVYNEPLCSSSNLNHAVLATGYGTTTAGVPYWIVKNSWGTSWGQRGYILMSRNKNNQCGIATYAMYPTV